MADAFPDVSFENDFFIFDNHGGDSRVLEEIVQAAGDDIRDFLRVERVTDAILNFAQDSGFVQVLFVLFFFLLEEFVGLFLFEREKDGDEAEDSGGNYGDEHGQHIL